MLLERKKYGQGARAGTGKIKFTLILVQQAASWWGGGTDGHAPHPIKVLANFMV